MSELPDPKLICDAFDLGEPLAEMTPVAGGLTNRLARLETSRGTFAIKTMNRDPAFVGYDDWIERAFRVESAACAAGISMPQPIAVAATGICLAECPNPDGEPWTVRAHAWVEGEPLQRIVYPATTAAKVGAIIAQIHALGIAAGESVATALRTFGAEHWDALAQRVEQSDVDWGWHFRSCLPAAAEIEAFVASARDADARLILSHRDADQKNFMKTSDGGLMLVDWDAVGPVSARHEIASLALVWGGVDFGEPSREAARALLSGYRDAGGELDAIRASDFGEFLCVMLGWFEYNVRRALGDRNRDEGDRELAAKIVTRFFASLPRFARSPERWAAALNG